MISALCLLKRKEKISSICHGLQWFLSQWFNPKLRNSFWNFPSLLPRKQIFISPNPMSFPQFNFFLVCSKSLSRVQLFCDPMDCSPPGFSVYRISQGRILEWIADFFSRGSSWSRDWTQVSCIGRQILYHWVTGEAGVAFIF